MTHWKSQYLYIELLRDFIDLIIIDSTACHHKTTCTLYSLLGLLSNAISNNSDFVNVESNSIPWFSNHSMTWSFRIDLLTGFEYSVSSECQVALSMTIVICRLRPYFKNRTLDILIRTKFTVIFPETKSCLFNPFEKMNRCHRVIFWTVENFHRRQMKSTCIDQSRYCQSST